MASIDPSIASAAQIPLQSFKIPESPPESTNLKALTLTSDIKLDDYSKLLEDFSVPKLPASIESLTLELFSLGYPPGFLTALSERLPSLKSLVLYSQLFAGISEESRKDAERFFENEQGLRELHLLDVFARPGFLANVGKTMSAREEGLRFLEVNYSYRHEDEDFLARVPAADLVHLIAPSLVTCAFNISSPDVTDDPDDPTNLGEGDKDTLTRKEGVVALSQVYSSSLLDKLVEQRTAPTGLLLLNIALYTVKLEQLTQILKRHRGLLILTATIYLEPTEEHKQRLLNALTHCPNLEQVELVGYPSLEFYQAVCSHNSISQTSHQRPRLQNRKRKR